MLNFKTNDEGWEGDNDKTYTAKLLLGLMENVIEADTDDKNPKNFVNKFVSYTVDDDGIYTLKAKDKTSEKGTIHLTRRTFKSTPTAPIKTGGEYYANSSTIFLVYDTEEKECSVYTGIDNVPSMDGSATVYVNSKNGESAA